MMTMTRDELTMWCVVLAPVFFLLAVFFGWRGWFRK